MGAVGRRAVRKWTAAAVVAAALVLAPRGARAQDGGRGYLFGTPTTTFTIHVGYDAAMANSDLFTFSDSVWTLRKGDYGGPMISTELGFRLNPQVDAVFGLGYARSATEAQYRDWLDNNNQPIQQSTEFTRVPMTVNLKAYLEPRGRAVGRYAWVPAAITPYVGGGVGLMWYEFRQGGDFIDNSTSNVHSDVLSSSAWVPMGDLLVGSEFSITPGMALNTEARYSVASGPLSNDYVGFHRIDLSGLSITAGLTFRF